LGVGHYNARFFVSAAGVASGLFPVEVAARRRHSVKQLEDSYWSGSRTVVLAVGLGDDPNADGGRDAVRGVDTPAISDSGAVCLAVFS